MVKPSTGVLLIADPFLKDPNFLRTVVFLCEHKAEGSFGFVLNRQYENTLDELIPDLVGHPMPIYYGGPVQPDSIHFLHQYPNEVPGGQEVMKGVYWGGDFDALVNLILTSKVDPSRIKFFIGYSGWSGDQLMEEMEAKTWLTVKALKKLVFHKKHTEIWKDALNQMGGEYKMMANYPIDPQLN